MFSKIITTFFGKKSDKDIKELTPYIDLVNSKYDEFQSFNRYVYGEFYN